MDNPEPAIINHLYRNIAHVLEEYLSFAMELPGHIKEPLNNGNEVWVCPIRKNENITLLLLCVVVLVRLAPRTEELWRSYNNQLFQN